MRRAFTLAERGPQNGPNPRVGAVVLSATGEIVGEGWHRGAGTPHAEVAALADVRRRSHPTQGTTIVVSLEPCNHTGLTPACTSALRDAGVARVVYSVADPNPAAAGGGQTLRALGVEVVDDLMAAQGREVLGPWWSAMTLGRPYVTLKTAMSLDGRAAAADGTSRWITSPQSREHAHQVRAGMGAILVGTGTVLADDPELTARADGTVVARPLRVVMGRRDLPPDARLLTDGFATLHLRTHDPAEVLADLWSRQVRHLLVEGGPTVASAFLRAGLVDEVQAYLAPVLLGSGRPAVLDLGVTTLADAVRLAPVSTQQLGPDTLVVARREEH
jgi:diaminohydroxyphosphoribosylaminopyrimidine deaminase / 5-amino-6-(5-phosphoribosylamino)uracil reductase